MRGGRFVDNYFGDVSGCVCHFVLLLLGRVEMDFATITEDSSSQHDYTYYGVSRFVDVLNGMSISVLPAEAADTSRDSLFWSVFVLLGETQYHTEVLGWVRE